MIKITSTAPQPLPSFTHSITSHSLYLPRYSSCGCPVVANILQTGNPSAIRFSPRGKAFPYITSLCDTTPASSPRLSSPSKSLRLKVRPKEVYPVTSRTKRLVFLSICSLISGIFAFFLGAVCCRCLST